MVKKLFGSPSRSFSSSQTPTGFGSLPGFGQQGFENLIQRGTDLSQDTSLFAPPGLTGQQEAALGTLEQGLQPISPEQFQTGLATFSNPFEEQVVQSAIRDLQETGRGQFSDIGTLASSASGFGGTRQALLESELFKNIQQNVGDVSGQLRQQGFQSAADRTLSELARTQDVAGNLFQFGELPRQIQQQQQQAPLAGVNFLQQLLQGLPTGGGGTSSGTNIGATTGAIPGATQAFGNIFNPIQFGV